MQMIDRRSLIQSLNNRFFPHDKKQEHFMALNGLRGLAILMVLLSHSGNLGFVFADFLDFQKTGKIGVYLFLVLFLWNSNITSFRLSSCLSVIAS